MTRRRVSFFFSSIVLLLCLALPAGAATPAEQGCGVPRLAPSTAPNIFSDEQQVMLGDVMADMSHDRVESIDDPELTGYLQQLGERIVRHLPPSRLQYRFSLAEVPISNAFSWSGGRVYVTRKLVAAARNEDEVAGVLGHELGHIITHQQAVKWTFFFSKALGVTSVSDRKDIEEKVDQIFQLSSVRKLGSALKMTENEQQEADRVGMEAVVLAGYRPDALADYFDRITENKRKTGSWFSELFQTTPPSAKRYREMLKLLPKMPTKCLEVRPASAAAEFQAWQKKVAAYRGTGRQESLHNVVLKRELEPPLQDEVRTLRFSPDGKLFLAQDTGTVYVARRNPPEVLFQIPAPGAYPAMFTADSSEILVYDRTMHIERWDIGSQERTEVYEVSTAAGCLQISVAPDGNTLACLEQKVEPGKGRLRSPINLMLIDTESNEPFFERKEFHHPNLALVGGYFGNLGGPGHVSQLRVQVSLSNMGFSPDGRYFLAASGTSKPVGYDLKARSEMPLPGPLANMLKGNFAFLGNGRVVGNAGGNIDKTRVARFPGGDLIAAVDTGVARIMGASHGDYLLLRPVQGYAVGVLDISQNKVVRANKKAAFDVYDDTDLSELGNGEVGLFRDGTTPVAKIKLPRGQLGRLEALSISPDLHWLALSEAGRGAAWDLTTGAQTYSVKGFQGSYIGLDSGLYVDFPKQGGVPRSIVRMGLESKDLRAVQSLGEDAQATVHGAFLMVLRPIEEKAPEEQAKLREEEQAKARGDFEEARRVDVLERPAQHVILEVKSTRTGMSLWSRRFEHQMPHINFEAGNLVLRWRYDEDWAKSSPADAADSNHLKGEKGDYVLEVLDAATGAMRGRVLVASSKRLFQVVRAYAAGNHVFVIDTRGRVLVYALKEGSLTGHTYGRLRAIASDGGRFCVEAQRGRLVIYDSTTMNKVDEFAFRQAVTAVQFEPKRLFVLTSNQTVYGLETQ